MIDWSAKVTPHFGWGEFVTGEAIDSRRRGLAASTGAQSGIKQLADVLEGLRMVLDAPIRITSGYRGPTQTGSQHDTGHAVDIQVDGMKVLDLLGLVYGWSEQSPHPLRQVGAESLGRSLDVVMARGSGVWLHLAVRTGPWTRPSVKPWFTSVAPVSGRRLYVDWSPA